MDKSFLLQLHALNTKKIEHLYSQKMDIHHENNPFYY